MQQKFYLLLPSVILLLSSCCADKQCPAFDTTIKEQWLSPSLGDSLAFRDETGKTIAFIVDRSDVTEAYVIEGEGSFPYCRHQEDCSAKANILATTDATGKVPQGHYSLSFDEDDYSSGTVPYTIGYGLGDMNGRVNLTPYITMSRSSETVEMKRDSILPDVTINGQSYEFVMVSTRNPSDPAYESYFIQKLYFVQHRGIIGFVSKGTLYWLSN